MNEYNVNVQFERKTLSFLCPEDQDIISSAKRNEIDLLNSSCSGVCISYSSMILERVVKQEDATGLNDDLKEKGFALLCAAYPKYDLHLVIGDQVKDDLCDDQFGKYQK